MIFSIYYSFRHISKAKNLSSKTQVHLKTNAKAFKEKLLCVLSKTSRRFIQNTKESFQGIKSLQTTRLKTQVHLKTNAKAFKEKLLCVLSKTSRRFIQNTKESFQGIKSLQTTRLRRAVLYTLLYISNPVLFQERCIFPCQASSRCSAGTGPTTDGCLV